MHVTLQMEWRVDHVQSHVHERPNLRTPCANVHGINGCIVFLIDVYVCVFQSNHHDNRHVYVDRFQFQSRLLICSKTVVSQSEKNKWNDGGPKTKQNKKNSKIDSTVKNKMLKIRLRLSIYNFINFMWKEFITNFIF